MVSLYFTQKLGYGLVVMCTNFQVVFANSLVETNQFVSNNPQGHIKPDY